MKTIDKLKITQMTLMYAHWCGHCKRFLPEWEKVKEYVKENKLPINIVEYESEKDKEEIDKAAKAKKFSGYPTLLLKDVNGNEVEYEGQRTFVAILNHIGIKVTSSDKPTLKTTTTNAARYNVHTAVQGGGGYLGSMAALADKHKYMKYKSKYLKLVSKC